MKTTLALLCLCMASCVTDPSYIGFVQADRFRKEAIGSQWMAYVLADPAKSPAQRTDAQALLDAWEDDLLASELRTGLR